MSRLRAKAYMYNPYAIPEETPEQVSTAPIPPPAPSVASPRSQSTIVPMRFGPAVTVPTSPEPEHARSPTPKRSPKPPPARTPTPPRPEQVAVTSPRAAYANQAGPSTLLEPEAPYTRHRTPPSPMSSFSTLPPDQYPDDATAESATEVPSYLPSPQTESTFLPDYETKRGDSPGPALPGAMFSTRTPSPHYNQNRYEIPQQRSPSPPLRTYVTPEGPLSPGDEIPAENNAADTDATATVRSAGSTPPARAMATPSPFDDTSRISVSGSTEVSSSEYEGTCVSAYAW
jgi:hypothetical protein